MKEEIATSVRVEAGRQRLSDQLENTRRMAAVRKVQIAAAPDVRHRVLRDLPGAIQLQPGELRIEFAGADDLLRQPVRALAGHGERF